MPRGKKPATSSKRAFVLSLPADMPAKELVERAKAAGLRIKENYVYVVRSNARLEKTNGARKSRAPNGAGKHAVSLESQFRRLALELGLGKSKELLGETEQKIADLIAGK